MITRRPARIVEATFFDYFKARSPPGTLVFDGRAPASLLHSTQSGRQGNFGAVAAESVVGVERHTRCAVKMLVLKLTVNRG